MIDRNHPAARPKGLGPDDLAQVILDSIDDDEPPTALYTLNIHEARMIAHAVRNAARLARAEEYRASREFAEGAWGGASMRLEFADALRAALNGDDQ